jgi:hypothetical protein
MREIKFRAWDNVNLEMVNDTEEIFDQWPNIYIMQYTWIKDRHGKEIYEGDIVMGWEVKYYTELNYYSWWARHPWFYIEKDYWELEYHKDLDNSQEIIGNIYENPELLAEGNNNI